RAEVRPDEGGSRIRRLAGRLRIRGGRFPACLRHAPGAGAGAACEGISPAGRPLRPVADAGGGERDRRAQRGLALVEGAARQRGAALGRDRLPGRGRARDDDGRTACAPRRGDRDLPPGRAERRAADAARGRARLEADRLLAVRHGVPPHQGGGGAGGGACLRRAADAARPAGRQHLRELPRGTPRLLPAHGAAARVEGAGGALELAAVLLRRAVRAQGRSRQRPGAGRGAGGAVAADRGGEFPHRCREAPAPRPAAATGGLMKAGVRGGGSRFLYEPFDVTQARLDASERIAEERWVQVERRLNQIETMLDRLEKRVWLFVYGAA